MPNPAWPALPYEAWKDTYETLHMWTQIVGKIRLARMPWLNHTWQVTLYPTAVGVACQSRAARLKVAGLALIKLTRLRQHAGRAVAPSAHGPRGRGASPPIIRICAGGASFYAGGPGAHAARGRPRL